ncbi:hypothetical protein ACGFYA_23475 [Streptomyces sp. NPDC048305]|uniref:hypothetical protein n=1 Tax=Streptomyces sp. NPDC048305 TaxID=3365532 RepID=UPI00371374A3
MTQVVLVHGIGPASQTAEELTADWTAALVSTLRMHGHARQAELLEGTTGSIDMAYYRHLFSRYLPADDLDVPLTEEMARVAGMTGEDIMDNIRRNASDPAEREEAARELDWLRAEVGPEQGPFEPVRLVISMLGRLGPVARSGFAGLSRYGIFHLGQVAAYLDDEVVRERAIESVLASVTPDTKAVLAHSLGTVVAYEALHRLGQPLPLLVTFGSPLGMRSIIHQRLRPLPLRSPAQVKRWVNVADRDDFIVSTLKLRKLFPENDDVLERTVLVRNSNIDPHSATEYLKHRRTVEPLAEIL